MKKLINAALLILLSSTFAQAEFSIVETGQSFATRTVAGSASWGDFDGDGDIDLFVTLGENGRNTLYRNIGNGQFDIPNDHEIGDLYWDEWISPQTIWSDLDNDGDLDLYVINRRTIFGGPLTNDLIYWNNGHGSFKRLAVAGTSNAISLLPHGGSMVDFDNDGDLDLFEPCSNYDETSLLDILFRNDRNGVFNRLGRTEVKGVLLSRLPNNAAWADFDGDNDLDVIVAENRSITDQAYLLENLHSDSTGIKFQRINGGPNARGIELTQSGAVLWADCDNDGDLDLITTHNENGFRIHRRNANGLYDSEPNIRPGAEGVLFVACIDVENDGDLDLVAFKIPYGNAAFYYSLLINSGDGKTFNEQSFASDQPQIWGNGPAVGDFNNDGYSDVFVLYEYNPGHLYQNPGGDNHWLKLVLQGTTSNSSAVGAIVRVKATIDNQEVWQMRQVAAGGEAFRVQHDIRPNFGLGDATVTEVVRIEWPSGTVQELTNIAADQILTVIEPPRLKIESNGQLSWPVTADGYRLEMATSLNGAWSAANDAIDTVGSRKVVSIGTDQVSRFYRLRD
jgi:hypothetical protein